MGGLEADTIGGYNSMLEKQKNEEGEALISTVLFDDRTEILHDRKDLKDVKPITDKEYFVRGCTALLDAMGSTIEHIKKKGKADGVSEDEIKEYDDDVQKATDEHIKRIDDAVKAKSEEIMTV